MNRRFQRQGDDVVKIIGLIVRTITHRNRPSHITLTAQPRGCMYSLHTLDTHGPQKITSSPKLQPPNDFKIHNSDDLHVKILLQYFGPVGKHCG